MTLTQENLKQVLYYNPNTGIFIWIKNNNTRLEGTEAGCICKRSNNKYRYIQINNKKWAAHRLAFLYMGKEVPKLIDHIDRNGLNNNWNNLRSASNTENQANSVIQRKNNTTGLKGIYWVERLKKWKVEITSENKRYYLGLFSSKEEAALVYNKRAVELFGEFANLNPSSASTFEGPATLPNPSGI